MLMHGPRSTGGGWAWLPALLVAVCAVAATAHGLFEVAVAARVPPWMAWTYPVITDGLALVAYAATHRLRGWAAGYAWVVTVLAAALSGLAQAVYLASDPLVAGPELRFGVGAWPAIAAAIVAHLLYLLATPAKPTVPARPRLVADLVALSPPTTPPIPPGEPTCAPSGSVAAGLTPPRTVQARATPASTRDTTADDRLAEVARLVAEGGGRGTVAKKLGVSPAVARRLVDLVKAPA